MLLRSSGGRPSCIPSECHFLATFTITCEDNSCKVGLPVISDLETCKHKTEFQWNHMYMCVTSETLKLLYLLSAHCFFLSFLVTRDLYTCIKETISQSDRNKPPYISLPWLQYFISNLKQQGLTVPWTLRSHIKSVVSSWLSSRALTVRSNRGG